MIRTDRVSKDYGAVRAVDEVSFEIAAGEVVGFLGPNGAGKSTLLKMLATYLTPSAGSLTICGFDTRTDALEARARTGYLPEHNPLFDGMRVDRFLRFVGSARGMSGGHLGERLEWVADRCGLGDVLGKRVGACSKGYRQRVGLAAALIHDPPVLLLDEPTHGLDPLQVVAFRDFVHELSPGRAILFSSHILSEVTEICGRLLAVQGGRLVVDAPVPDLVAAAEEEGATLEQHLLGRVRAGAGDAA